MFPRALRCLQALTVSGFVLLAGALQALAAPTLRFEPRLSAASGYDTNAYLDASSLPSTSSNSADDDDPGGPLLRVSPSIAALWQISPSQQLLASYELRVDQFMGGDAERETVLRHGGALAYLPPAVAGFELLLQAGMQQLLFRSASVGWWQGFARARLGRELWGGLSAALSYVGGYVAYQEGDASSDNGDVSSGAGQNVGSLTSEEWTHGAEVEVSYEPLSWLKLTVSYSLARTLATPRPVTVGEEVHTPPENAFDAWRHGVGGRVVFMPAGMPLSLSLGYQLWLVDFDDFAAGQGQGGGGGGPGTGTGQGAKGPPPIATRSRLHQLEAAVSWQLFEWLALDLRYAALFGENDSTTPAVAGKAASDRTDTAQRHQVLAGLTLSWGTSAGQVVPGPVEPPRRPSGLELRVHAPQAEQVAVIGSFNGWDRRRNMLRRTAGGHWVGKVPLPPGEHRYSLWIDGKVRPPKRCETLVADGFGGYNCSISIGKEPTVGGPRSATVRAASGGG